MKGQRSSKKIDSSTGKYRKISSFILGLLTVLLIPTFIYFAFNTLSKRIITVGTASNITPGVTKTITPTVTLDPNRKQVECTFDKEKCNLINTIVSIISTKNMDAFISYQGKDTITCNDYSQPQQYVCDGAKDGDVKTGYTIGYYQSESEFILESDYKEDLTRRLTQGGYEYYQSIAKDNKVGIIFTSPDQQGFFMLPLQRTNGSWKMSYLLMGFPDKKVYDLDSSLLNYIR